MKIKDKIGLAITSYLMPYIRNDYLRRGEFMRSNIDYEEYQLLEKYVWFLGKEDLIADFYKTRQCNYLIYNPREQYYYSQAGNDIRYVHSGMPSLISYSKARLLMTGDLKYKVVRKETERKTETRLLDNICKDNKINDIIKRGVITESWGQRFAYKLSYDPEVSEYPIIEAYNPLEYKTVYKRNRLQKIIFINKYYDGEYELEEEYGKGYIDYYLYHVVDGTRIPTELSALEETKDLERIDFKDKTLMLAMEKKTDKSDYDGIISEFDSLDEAWSQLMDEIRLGRSEVYVPEMLLTNKTFNKFRKNYAVLGSDMRENGTNKIEHIQPDIRPEAYQTTINVITNNILLAVGLSPFTIGIDDGIGANSSGDALAKREATSLRTRDEMVKSWEPFLEEFFNLLLKANDVFNKKASQDYEVKVDFGDYITPSREEIINQVKTMIDGNIIDTEKALEEIYGELDEDEKIRILANTGNVTEPTEPIEEDNQDNNNQNEEQNQEEQQEK